MGASGPISGQCIPELKMQKKLLMKPMSVSIGCWNVDTIKRPVGRPPLREYDGYCQNCGKECPGSYCDKECMDEAERFERYRERDERRSRNK